MNWDSLWLESDSEDDEVSRKDAFLLCLKKSMAEYKSAADLKRARWFCLSPLRGRRNVCNDAIKSAMLLFKARP